MINHNSLDAAVNRVLYPLAAEQRELDEWRRVCTCRHSMPFGARPVLVGDAYTVVRRAVTV